jgi:hypothetical protein
MALIDSEILSLMRVWVPLTINGDVGWVGVTGLPKIPDNTNMVVINRDLPFEVVKLVDNKILFTTKGSCSEQEISPGKFIRLFLDLISVDNFETNVSRQRFVDKYIQEFSEKITAPVSEIKVSENIKDIYLIPTAPIGSGTLADSCQRYEEQPQSFENLDNLKEFGCKIVYILNKNKKLLARSLLWHNVQEIGGDKIFNFMDKIYGSPFQMQNLKNWGVNNGYYYKLTQSSYSHRLTNNQDIIINYKKKLPPNVNHLPYMDSFVYYDGKYITTNSGGGVFIELDNIRGCDIREDFKKEGLRLEKLI